jgi:succinate--hydroxymethylglutarate CoA-transferase
MIERVHNRVELIEILQNIVNQHTTAHWEKELEANKIPYGPINNMKEVFEDPQVLHRKMVEEIEHPIVGKVRLVGLPVKYSETPTTIRTAPPLLGEQTTEVMQNLLGYSKEQIDDLIKANVVCQFEQGIFKPNKIIVS